MKLQLIIDGIPHNIDSTNPELLGKWVVEIFGRVPMVYPSTLIEVQVEPSWVPTSRDGQWEPDWVADSRVIGQMRPVRSPRDLLAALAAQLDELDALQEVKQ
jgi:hypothetical protein